MLLWLEKFAIMKQPDWQHSALTGHIVLSTLHTNNAIGVIKINRYENRAVFNRSIIKFDGSKRLVGRLCQSCKIAETASPEISAIIKN